MKTLLLGIDGATFTLLDPFMQNGVMPYLRDMVSCGARADLLSTPLHLTPQAWTSLVTGRSPGHHGVFDFVRPEKLPHGLSVHLVNGRDNHCETIWSFATRNQCKVTSLNYPVTFPHPPVAGYLIPGFVSGRSLRLATYPPDIFDQMDALPSFNVKMLGWNLDLEEKSVQSLPREDYSDWIKYHLQREFQWFQVLMHLMENDPCDLTMIVFDGADKLQHLAWPLVSALPSDGSVWEQEIRDLCLDYFRQLDGYLAKIVQTAGEQTRVFLASDHGFGPSSDIFYLNVWLNEHGYLYWNSSSSVKDVDDKMFASRRQTLNFDWKKTLAYALTPSSNGIYIRVAEQLGQPGVPPEQYELFREELITGLLNFRAPQTGETVVTRVMKREEIYAGEFMHLAPDLTLVLRDYGFVSVIKADSVFKQRSEPKGMHRPEGIFIAVGPGIRRGSRLASLSILDVYPTLLYSLGLPIPPNLDGRLPTNIFEPDYLLANPPLYAQEQSASDSSFREEEVALPSEDDELILSVLRSLGYIE